MTLLRLSKKSKGPTLIILAPLRINNLQATENRKMPRIKVFRQALYFSLLRSIAKLNFRTSRQLEND